MNNIEKLTNAINQALVAIDDLKDQIEIENDKIKALYEDDKEYQDNLNEIDKLKARNREIKEIMLGYDTSRQIVKAQKEIVKDLKDQIKSLKHSLSQCLEEYKFVEGKDTFVASNGVVYKIEHLYKLIENK